jgi:hypothetical protein
MASGVRYACADGRQEANLPQAKPSEQAEPQDPDPADTEEPTRVERQPAASG